MRRQQSALERGSRQAFVQDFVFPGGRFADSKATTKAQRFHEISSIDQVARREATHSCMVSHVLRPVAKDEGLSIPQLIDNIGNLLMANQIGLRRRSVRSNLTLKCAAAITFESHARPTTLYSVDEIPGVLQFTPLPAGVPTLSWPVVLSEGEGHGMAMNAVLTAWIGESTEVMDGE